MRKSFVLLVFVLLFTVLLSATAVAAGEQILISAPSQVNIGDTFNVVIQLGNATDLYGFSLDMVFDPSIVQVNSVTLHSIFGSEQGRTSEVVNTIDNSGGTIEYAVILVGSGDGVNLTTPANALTISCTAQTTEATWAISVTDSTSALSAGGINTRILLSDSNADKIATNSPINSIIIFDGNSDEIVEGKLIRTCSDYHGNTLFITKFSGSTDQTTRVFIESYDTNTGNRATKVYFNDSDLAIEKYFFDSDGNTTNLQLFYNDGKTVMQGFVYNVSTGKRTSRYFFDSDGNTTNLQLLYPDGFTVMQGFVYDIATNKRTSRYFFDTEGRTTNLQLFYDDGITIMQGIVYDVSSGIRTSIYYFDTQGKTTNLRLLYPDGKTVEQGFVYNVETGRRTSRYFFDEQGRVEKLWILYSDGISTEESIIYNPNTGAPVVHYYYDIDGNITNTIVY